MSSVYNVSYGTKRLTMLGLMSAITIIMVWTPIGMIPLPMISLTISHIPAIITAILLGPAAGGIIGLVFGLSALLRALLAPQGIFDPLFINPLVSVLPRVAMGLGAYYVYALFDKINRPAGIIAGAAAGSMINTLGCLGALYVLYAKEIVANIGGSAEAFIWGIITTSGVIEAVTAVVIALPVTLVLKKMFAYDTGKYRYR